MTSKPEDTNPVALIDNPLAPEVFADEAVGFFIHNGNVSITLASARVNHAKSPGPIGRVVSARLVLPLVGAQALAAGLYDFLQKIKADPVPRDATQTVQ